MAIALDNFAQSNAGADFSYLCGSGLNRYLIAGVLMGSSGSITGISFDSVGMNQIGNEVGTANSGFLTTWNLVGPNSGNKTVHVSAGQAWLDILIASYTGVRQSSQPDAHTDQTLTANVGAVSQTINTVADNCWAVYMTFDSNDSSGWTFTNVTNRQSISTGTQNDTNGVIHPAGSFTATITPSGIAQDWGVSLFSFAPVIGGPGLASSGPFVLPDLVHWAKTEPVSGWSC